MPAYSFLALALLSSLGKVKGKHTDIRSREGSQAYERRLSLFTGRGIICLGAAPRSSERKDVEY